MDAVKQTCSGVFMADVIFGPVDYLFTGAGSQPVTFAFFYPAGLDAAGLSMALEETVRHFPSVAGRLVPSGDREYRYRLDQNPSIEVLESELPFSRSRDIRRYISPVITAEGDPLARIALTQIPDGSVLGVSLSHALVDGFSFFHFMSSWARVSRGERFLEPGLCRDGAFPAFQDSGRTIGEKEIFDDCGLFYGESRPDSPAGSREERLLVSKEELKAMTDEARKKLPDVMLSENDLITASVWKKYLPRWTSARGDTETHVTCPVDFRRILKSLPKHYFGCAVCFTTATASLDDLHRCPVEDLALLVNRSVRKMNQDAVRRSLGTFDALRRQKGPAAFQKVHLKHPQSGLIVTNLTRMPVHDLDFGSGVPADFLIFSEAPGGAAILPSENGIEIVLLHPSEKKFP
jgi:shikimate O-hydroxycinnamoyltransferase